MWCRVTVTLIFQIWYFLPIMSLNFSKFLNKNFEQKFGIYEYFLFKNSTFHITYNPFKPIARFYQRSLPKSFDWGENPPCPTNGQVINNGECFAPLAVVLLSTLSDRECIQSNGKKHFEYSVQDFLTCCHFKITDNLCLDTKNMFKSLKCWLKDGIVSGGPYKSNKGCKPTSEDIITNYEIDTSTFNCTTICSNKNYKKSYYADKSYGEKIKLIMTSNPFDICEEIMTYGPVISFFSLLENFFHDWKGIYQFDKEAALVATIPVKIIGWGEDNGTFYWCIFVPVLTNNSVTKSGIFKVSRDKGLEKIIFAPMVNTEMSGSITKKAESLGLTISSTTIFFLFVVELAVAIVSQ